MKRADPYAYCMRVVKKMVTYVQTMHNIDILNMDVDFYRDDNDNIWMSHASNIVVKNNQDFKEVKRLTGIYLMGQRIINKIKDTMKREGLRFDEEKFLAAKARRPKHEPERGPDQLDNIKQLEADLDIKRMPVDIQELEQTGEIDALTDEQLAHATRKLNP